MKVLERLVLVHLKPQVSIFVDQVQFAYFMEVGVEDAIFYLLKRAHSNLDKAGSPVRIMFFDCTSAFNTRVHSRRLYSHLPSLRCAPLTFCKTLTPATRRNSQMTLLLWGVPEWRGE